MTFRRTPDFQNNRLSGTGQILASETVVVCFTFGYREYTSNHEHRVTAPTPFGRAASIVRFAKCDSMTAVNGTKTAAASTGPGGDRARHGHFLDRCWPPSLATGWLWLRSRPSRGRFDVAADRGPRLAGGFLLCWVMCLGGARHHLFWSTAEPDDLSLFAKDEPRLVRLSATLVDQPEIILANRSRFAFGLGAARHECGDLLAAASSPRGANCRSPDGPPFE